MIDIHQHLNFLGRSNHDLIQHQEDMGADLTVLLPSAGPRGRDNGLLAHVPDTEAAYQFVQQFSGFLFAANSPVTELNLLADYIEKGAKLIGELKFDSPGNSSELWAYAEVAQQYKIPVLIHFEHNLGIKLDEFKETLERFPDVNFIGHAVQWWAELEGATDRLMRDYNNLYGDLSAGSGYSSLVKECSPDFIVRHQDHLLFGTDCSGVPGICTLCHKIIERIGDLGDESIRKKIFSENALTLLDLKPPT